MSCRHIKVGSDMMENDVLNGDMGLCVADALGVPVEFMERHILTKKTCGWYESISHLPLT